MLWKTLFALLRPRFGIGWQSLLGICGCLLLSTTLSAAPPQGWRGDGTGAFSARQPPSTWSSSENIAWFRPLPTWSNAQPVIVRDRIFVLSEPDLLYCLSRSTGEVLWERKNDYRTLIGEEDWPAIQAEVQRGEQILKQIDPLKAELAEVTQREEATSVPENRARIEQLETAIAAKTAEFDELPLAKLYTLPITHETLCGYTTATPTANEEFVWSVFGNGVVACFDHAGNRQWMVRLEDQPHSMWGHSASPLLIGDRLFVNVDALVCLDARTGETIWKKKYNQCWGSSIHTQVDGVDLLVLGNGKVLRAEDGQLLARALIPSNVSPLLHGREVYFIQDPAQCVRLPEKLPTQAGEKIELEVVWDSKTRGGTVYASPVWVDGRIWSISANGVLNLLDAATGKLLISRRMNLGNGTAYPSLTAAGDYIYVSHDSGLTVVLRNDVEATEVARNQLDGFMSTPLLADERLYIRTRKGLFAIGR